jgi:histone arginine demethylase JMJD6
LDDSPLYIFDGTFADRSGSAAMCQDYQLPPLFREDLFKLVGEKRRPPHR